MYCFPNCEISTVKLVLRIKSLIPSPLTRCAGTSKFALVNGDSDASQLSYTM